LNPQSLFRPVWLLTNVLLVIALLAVIWSGFTEFHLRQYLKGFSNAIVLVESSPQQKVEAILAWMSKGPRRPANEDADTSSRRDLQDSLNYQNLLAECGSSTNAFLFLSRSSGVETRRLLLITPEGTTKHVVAEVYIDGRWAIVDPDYHLLMKDARGNLLTRKDLQNPERLRDATTSLLDYRKECTYDRYAHVRLEALPFNDPRVRGFAEWFFPDGEQYLDWSLLLERRSFLYLFFSTCSLLFLALVRATLAWVADHFLGFRPCCPLPKER
jgi:hypothetical protein